MNTPPASLPPVLYVEDEEDDVLFMQRAFAKAGVIHPLAIAPDGRKGLDYLTRAAKDGCPPSLVILDLNLPLVSGFQLLRWIRDQAVFCSMPVVVVSSSAQESDLEQARQHRANDYFVKPGNPSELTELVRQFQDRWLASAVGGEGE